MAGLTVHEAEILARTDYAAMRKEYTRMRDIAQKRVQRLGQSAPNSKAYQSNKGGFAKLKDLDRRDLAKAYSELSKFVGAKSTTVSGQKAIKRKTIETWQQQGLGLTPANYDKAIKILEKMRKQKIVYGSDKVVELADAMVGLTPQQTNEWLDHLDELLPHSNELQEIPEVEGYSFEEVMQMIGE